MLLQISVSHINKVPESIYNNDDELCKFYTYADSDMQVLVLSGNLSYGYHRVHMLYRDQ